jgi:hypothetical protein
MKTYKEFCFGEEYLDEGKAKAARELLKRGGKHGKKLLDKVKGKAGKAGKNATKGGGGGIAGKLGQAGVAGGVFAGGKALLDGAKDVAGAAAEKAKKIWAGGENDVDSDGAPSDHSGLPKSN